ncbi:MAG: aspartyl/asparaginyl beta-hydroxylase domain-containing protein [Bacteroidia bacterium]|nr:aspartyl/asparaginyl beta-hydroxylase domain-containing protein [Bacteroidia bacterium]
MKLWFSIYDETLYQGSEKSFYESEHYDWAKEILSQREIIVKEFYEVIKTEKLFDPYFNQMLTSHKGMWQTIGLKFWTINNYKNQAYFPNTTKVINKIPNLVSASFNKLQGGTDIKPHCGDTNGIFRCHLGIEIPAGLPNCGFEVNKEQREWKTDDLIIFCDAHNHTAWNHSNNDRYIFLFDIIRDEYKPKKNVIVSTVLSSMFLQKIALLLINMKQESNFKRSNLKPIVFILKPFAKLAVWYVNRFKVY